MLLIGNFEDVASADHAAEMLLSQGIMTHVSSRDTKLLGTRVSGFIKAGLWVVLEHQHEDAIQYLNNDRHIVTTGLSPEEIAEFESLAKASTFQSFNKALIWGVLLIFAMGYLLFKVAAPA